MVSKDRLRLAIDRYEKELISPQVSEINISFIWQLAYIAVLIIFAILMNLKPSWNSVIGTLGLSGLSLKASSKAARKTFERFRKDRRTLMQSVIDLRIRLDLCYEDDEPGLKDVESRIRQYLGEMHAMVFKIPFRGDRARILRKIQEEASKEGILFEGTTNSGKFEGQGIGGRIVGIYWFSHPQEITIQIERKPLLITENMIKKQIQGYLEDLY